MPRKIKIKIKINGSAMLEQRQNFAAKSIVAKKIQQKENT